MGAQVLLSISKDERERARLTSEYKYVVDQQSKVIDATRNKALDIARNLLNVGDSIEKIIMVTDLTREEVEGLQI